MKIAIVGSRDFDQYEKMVKILSIFGFDKEGNEIVSGGAKGADALGKAFAEDAGLKYTEFPADWKKGKGAGYERNKKIVEYANFVIAFWDGSSAGTCHTIELARKAKKPTLIFYH